MTHYLLLKFFQRPKDSKTQSLPKALATLHHDGIFCKILFIYLILAFSGFLVILKANMKKQKQKNN